MSFLGLSSGTAPPDNSHQHVPGEDCCGEKKDEQIRDHPLFAAVKSGMLVPVQNAQEQYQGAFSMRDDKGHTPAHWVALGGHAAVLRYLIENKAPVNEPSDNDLGARPIHWACVSGHIAIVDILLQAGVSFDVADNKGCTPLIVAAQYGHTMLAGYLMGKGARLQICDKDGDNALHWAAFKGHSELMRLLIYSGFNPRQQDNYGQTPLHLSCISGNLLSVQELCEEDGVEIDLPDKNGKTPLALAAGRKHEHVVDYLKMQVKKRNSLLPKIDFVTIAFGPPGNSKAAILFFMINVLCWGYPMYVIKCLPYTWNDLQIVHIMFFISNILMWFTLFHASTTDPGFLPRNIPEYDMAIKQVAHFDEWKQGENPLSRLCHTCRTVKPLRSKHCRICNRCIKMFDHHCPYIYNCVGYSNRPWFFCFVLTLFVLAILTNYYCYYLLREFGWDWVVVIGAVEAAIGIMSTTAVTILMSYHAGANLTANERINWKRYSYLKDGRGSYHNPFNRGVIENFKEFFFLRRLLTEKDVQILNV